MEQTLDISWNAIIKFFIAGFILYILFIAKDIVVWFFFALIISILLEPAILFLTKWKIPKIVAVIFIYLIIFGLLGLTVYLMAPLFVSELGQLSKSIPNYFEALNPILRNFGINVAQNFQEFTSGLVSGLQESSGSIIKAISVFFGGITSTSLIFLFAFYISLEDRGVEKVLSLMAPKKYEALIVTIFERAQFKVSGWFGARILACIFVGVLSFVLFFLLGVQYAFILALLSGILTFIPFIGPTITAALALVFVGVSSSWAMAIYIVIALTIIQELENKVLTPLLMQKFIDLPPILVLISILIGGEMFGFLGIIFMVPIAGIIYEFLKEFLEKRKEESNVS